MRFNGSFTNDEVRTAGGRFCVEPSFHRQYSFLRSDVVNPTVFSYDYLVCNFISLSVILSLIFPLRFETAEFLVGLVESMGSRAGSCLSAICRRLSRDFRHTRSGMPDLCVWNREDQKWRLVEVKGPNDKLSTKQVGP